MNETQILLQFGPFTVTVYSVVLALGALLGCLLGMVWTRKRDISLGDAAELAIAAVIGGVIGGRVFYCLAMLDTITEIYNEMYGSTFCLQIWQGGFNLYGAALGALGLSALWARIRRLSVAKALDAVALGGMLTLAAERMAECFSLQGMGHYVENEAFQMFPFAMTNMDGDYMIPVFLWDAAGTLLILIWVLAVADRMRPGRTAEALAVLESCLQIIMQSLREDEIIRFGFVRFNQCAAAVVIGGVMLIRMRRAVRANGWCLWNILRLVLFAACVALVILIEFALDKSSIDNGILYAVMAAGLVLFACTVLCEKREKVR